MKNTVIFLSFLFTILLAGCENNKKAKDDHGHDHPSEKEAESHGHNHGHAHEEQIILTSAQFNSLQIKVDTLVRRNLNNYVETNGQLEVPPQNEATVTAIIGANVSSIEVIEGDKVEKGQVLAYLSHPNLIQIQTDYITKWNELKYLKSEYDRQKKLYSEKVSSGKTFQKTEADFKSAEATVKGLKAQLSLLGLNTTSLQDGNIIEKVALKSPIEGYIRMVEVKTGQYVAPQTELFEIVNIHHIHADFMVFEKDIYKVKKGQKVLFTVESIPNQELEATIYSVGKAFEQDPKAIHLHAEIENKQGLLLPGMYARGRILTEEAQSMALPKDAVVKEDEGAFIFKAIQKGDKWIFKPLKIEVGMTDNGWVEIKTTKPIKTNTLFAKKGAYQLMAEMKKEEAEHSH